MKNNIYKIKILTNKIRQNFLINQQKQLKVALDRKDFQSFRKKLPLDY